MAIFFSWTWQITTRHVTHEHGIEARKLQGVKCELTCKLKFATWYTRPLARC